MSTKCDSYNSIHTKMSMSEFANFLRKEISQEKMLTFDFSYIAPMIDNWWKNEDQSKNIAILKAKLTSLFLNKLDDEHVSLFSSVGLIHSKIAAVCIKHIFTVDSPKLSLLVHEVLSDLFHIADIQYPYEEHKTLYLKASAVEFKDWGGGYGEITPHSDDLYENVNIDYLALTICRDETKTVTKCFFPKDILRDFNDEELFRLKDLKANFKSGKNIDILIERERNILEFSEKYGFRFFLDFRVDDITGERMRACELKDQALLDKIRNAFENCPYESSIPDTGTFFIVANHKVLHARAQMNIDKELATQFSQAPSLANTPRLLYRSKGPRRAYLAY